MVPGTCVECGNPVKPGTNKCPEHLAGIGRTPNRHHPKRTVVIWAIVACCILYFGYVLLKPSTEPVTLEEYAAVVCNRSGLPQSSTWGEARSWLRDLLDDMKRLEPPAEIVQYHEGRTAALSGMLKAMGGKPSGAPMNPIELAFDPTANAAMDADEAAVSSLTIDERRELYRLGCRF